MIKNKCRTTCFYYITRKHLIDFSNGKYTIKYLSSSSKCTINRIGCDHKEMRRPRYLGSKIGWTWREIEIEKKNKSCLDRSTVLKLKKCTEIIHSRMSKGIGNKNVQNRIYTSAINITKIQVIKSLTIFDPWIYTHTLTHTLTYTMFYMTCEQCNKQNRYKYIYIYNSRS